MPEPQRPVDGNHAFVSGVVTGALLKAESDGSWPFSVNLIDDEEGNHLAACRMTWPSGSYVVLVVPETQLEKLP